MVAGSYRAKPGVGKLNNKPHASAVVVASTDHGRFELAVVAPEKRRKDRSLPSEQGTCDVYLTIPDQRSAFNTLLNMTQYTKAELDAIKQVIDKAFALASPIIEERDSRAEEEQAARPDLFIPRLARAVPRVSVLPGFEPEHGGQLPAGYQDIPDSDGGDQE